MDDDMRAQFLFLWRTITHVAVWRLLLFFYILIPVMLKLFPSIFLQTVFSNRYKGPAVYSKLTQPEKDWNFVKSSNHYITSLSGNIIGIWHLPPHDGGSTSLNKADKVLLYCHGKSGNRATGHRTQFYQVLGKMGFHVVAFDYSGFGDSTGTPDGRTVTLDTISVYEWILDQMQRKDATVLIWGHSLGSAIVVSALKEISNKPWIQKPHGVILESTFTNLYEASKKAGLFRLFNIMYPYVFRKMFKNAARQNRMEFDTWRNLPKIKSNILILHSEDDPKIDVKLAQKVYDGVVKDPESHVETMRFYRIDSQYALGHNLVYNFQNLQDILLNFTTSIRKSSVITTKLRYEQFRV